MLVKLVNSVLAVGSAHSWFIHLNQQVFHFTKMHPSKNPKAAASQRCRVQRNSEDLGDAFHVRDLLFQVVEKVYWNKRDEENVLYLLVLPHEIFTWYAKMCSNLKCGAMICS